MRAIDHSKLLGVLLCVSIALMAFGEPVDVEMKPTPRQQLLYAMGLANDSFATPARTDERHRSAMRAAAAFELLMLRWPSSREAPVAAIEQVSLYESNLLFGNVVDAVTNAENRGIAKSDRGPELYSKAGKAQTFLRNFDAADSAYRAATTHPSFHRLRPEMQSVILADVGWSYRQRGDHRAAVDFYDRASRVADAPAVQRASAALEALLESDRGGGGERAALAAHVHEVIAEYRAAPRRSADEDFLIVNIEKELMQRRR